MNNDLQDFEQFMKRREDVAQAYVNGGAKPLRSIATLVSPATFFSPGGDYQQGAEHVISIQEQGAKQFEPGGKNKLEILQMSASDGIAYWVGLQRATARLKGKAEPVPMNLRVTEVFRREDDDWKLVHRHADFLKAESEETKNQK